MKTYYFLCFCFLFIQITEAQVGIGTTTPSQAAMLEISSSVDGIHFKGFMPPRVQTTAIRNSIQPSIEDEGLLIYIAETQSLQLWTGSSWQDIFTANNLTFNGVAQNFDLATSWGYATDVSFFDNTVNGFYGITDTSNSIFNNLSTLTNGFLGFRDLNDTEDGNGTTGFATITFDTINVSSFLNGTTIKFNYDVYRFDNGDDIEYILTIDGIEQPAVAIVNGMADLINSNVVTISIPGGTVTVGLQIRFRQDGATDVGGFDNFILFAN